LAQESLYRAFRLGRAGISQRQFPAGSTGNFKVWYEFGPEEFPSGTEVRFQVRGQRPLGPGLQASDPGKPNFVAMSGPKGIEPLPGCFVACRVSEGQKEGERITFAVRNYEFSPIAYRHELKVVINTYDGESPRRLPEPVVLEVVPLGLAGLEVYLPGSPPRKPRRLPSSGRWTGLTTV
jgi:hypothetical protein